MSLALLLAAQAAAAPPPPQGVIPTDFDLAQARPTRMSGECRRDGAAEILVCGARRGGAGAYPFAEMARLFAQRLIRAEMSLGGNAVGSAYLQQQVLDRGAVSNRIMFGIRWPF